MTDHQSPPPEEDPQPTPQPEDDPGKKEKPEGGKPDEKGFPVGQVATGGVGATVLGSYALASAVGPWGWAVAPVAAGAAGIGYVVYRRRKKRGGSEQTTKTTTTKTSGGRTGGGPLFGGRGSGSRSGGDTASAKRSGGVPAAGRGGSPAPGGRGSAARPAGAPRQGGGDAAPRRTGGGTGPQWGSGSRRSSGGDTTTSRRGGADATTSKGKGPMDKNRWGGSSGPTSGKKPGWGARARDWADDKTGRKMSSAWRGARGQKGFHSRRRAAASAVRKVGGGDFIATFLSILMAILTAIASLFGWGGDKKDKGPESGQGQGSGGQPDKEKKPDSEDKPEPDKTDDKPDTDEKPDNQPEGEPEVRSDSRSLPHAHAATQLLAEIAKYKPADLFEVIDQAKEWEHWVQDMTMSIQRYVQAIQGENIPLSAGSIAALETLFNLQAKSMEAALNVPVVMTKDHAEDIARRNHERGNEEKSNV